MRLALGLLLFSGVATAQTPHLYPLGEPIPATFCNDSTEVLQFQPCGPLVTDVDGNLLFIPICPAVILLLEPGECYTAWWGQNLDLGQQAPPGVYFVNGVPYDIGAADAALVPLGPPRVGKARPYFLTAPGDPDRPFLLAASGSSSTGIGLGCGQTFPLDLDPILLASLSYPTVFVDFVSQLDAFGQSTAPTLALPAVPSLAGVGLDLAFFTVDPTAPCGIGAISPVRSVTIAP